MRINDEILKETANIIRAELKDPRISAMTSVTKVETSNDLKYAKIYVSVLGDEVQKAEVMTGLKSAQGFIRKQIAERINLRVTPELKFIMDSSLEHGMKISKLLSEISK
ncbi:MAG: 30S ribosome-binding factor RbfA [Clostridiales bacterium]|nr:30S ribosome-binding factor RbfA [Clostridiales bacterium]